MRPLLLVGTRPEAIKMAPVWLEARARASLEPVLALTGQHRELLRPILDYFGLDVAADLDLMRPDQALAGIAARCLTGVDELLTRFEPDCVVAEGDTTTVLAAALASFYRRVPFVHVEAGLRTDDVNAPFPEELNRRVATLAASVHCAPTEAAAQRLRSEGVPARAVHLTGNTVVDALLLTIGRERKGERGPRAFPELREGRLVLVTCHRRESFGEALEGICRAIADLARLFPETKFVYPVHPNPSVRGPVHALLSGEKNVHLIEPAAYPEFVWLMDRSSLILTDSGGIQEEAPTLGKPVLVLRDKTERPEAVALGLSKLVGTDPERIKESVVSSLRGEGSGKATLPGNPYGDGKAAKRIVDLIERRAWLSRSGIP